MDRSISKTDKTCFFEKFMECSFLQVRNWKKKSRCRQLCKQKSWLWREAKSANDSFFFETFFNYCRNTLGSVRMIRESRCYCQQQNPNTLVKDRCRVCWNVSDGHISNRSQWASLTSTSHLRFVRHVDSCNSRCNPIALETCMVCE